jgi:uncharacterized protein (DUF1919 family)
MRAVSGLIETYARESSEMGSSGRALSSVLRWLARDTKFTIVSNNCWGAHVYQALRIEYRSPFVGLFIPPKSYLELLRRFDRYIRSDLTFTNESSSASINAWRDRERLHYPIGLLDGKLELHFQHYAGENEARSKWRRRCQRISPDPERWFFKFDDREGATAEDILDFCGLPLTNKVCFTRTPYALPTIVVPGEPGDVQVSDGVALSRISGRYFNTLRWVSTRSARIPVPSLL